MGSKMWLAVEVHEGMFPTEKAVRMQTHRGEWSGFVADMHIQRGESGAGRVRVEVMDSDHEYGLIEIPTQHGAQVVKVERAALAEAQ